ncbi:hypothetical protein GCM10027517_28970 [Phycicoccus ginsengisoli]
MSDDRWAGLPELLSRLEDLELHLLSWGVVDGHLSRDEVDRAIDEQLNDDASREPDLVVPTVDEYREHLVERGLLHEIPGTDHYRTRLAETLRLLRTLRQLWPPADESRPGWWRSYNTLVSDYRLRVSPRRYPRRSIPVATVIQELSTLGAWSEAKASVVRRMIGEDQLARFQVDATRSILSSLADPQPSATIVTAGTGSGKTRAFYLPALIDIAARVDEKRVGPHTLALYPRNELLRDQAREAVRVIESIGPLAGGASRPGRVAMLYGNTPTEKELEGRKDTKRWRRTSSGWETPYFPCLDDQCMAALVWTDDDRAQRIERLTCPKCGAVTQAAVLALTRESIKDDPPDILFSSTEMLSKHSTNATLGPVLGWKGANGIRLVLLDEVHTYTGVAGAQVALMLRRWRHANRRTGTPSPVFVGLSATLRDAGDFMSTLTGVDRAQVEAVAPASTDMVPTSREYGLVLRGDPVSGASLLSTTIQTAMLVSRILDNRAGIFGSVTFAFTDDLDVINRLHDSLHDAEGHDPYGMARGRVLADLRSPANEQAGARYPEGQSWDLPRKIDRMDRQMRVARTSSQDAGVDATADIIVATSSLEVGFNYPRVGAVIQHKAPRDMASFLQRRGRAGRKLAMRPITAVVLSDYGRDRITYQSYERLLDPEITVRSLPIGNRFVLKIQATHALLDWISRRTGINARWVLSSPGDPWQPRPRTEEVATLLAQLLRDANLQRELSIHLRWALQVTEDEATAALWDEPRSIMLSVVPTALRRLESQWKPMADSDPGAESSDPLPEFMTGALFGALNTPDVTFFLPFKDSDLQTMPIFQALREAVPGRVSRRYGHARADHATWLPVPENGDNLALTDIVARGHNLGTWRVKDEQYTVVRPFALKLSKPPRAVATSSQSYPVWRSAFEYQSADLLEGDVPHPSVWSKFIDRIGFTLHVSGAAMRVRRLAIGADGELLINEDKRFQRRPVSVRYAHAGEPAALGYELDVDGLVVSGNLDQVGADLGAFASSPAWRTAAFRQAVLEDARLNGVANSFQRSWLVEVYRHAHVNLGLGDGDVRDIPLALAGGRWADDMTAFLAASYRDDEGDIEGGRLLQTLRDLAGDATIRAVIEEHGRLLVHPDPAALTADLLDRVFVDTLGCALLTAVQECVPDAQENDLVVDAELDGATRRFQIFITETSIGGLGLVEALHRDYAQDPRVFWEAVGRACSPTESEEVDLALQALLADLVSPKSVFGPAVHAFRNATDVGGMDAALDSLVDQWTEVDGPPSHLLVSNFAARMLRPGSSLVIDQVVAKLAAGWVETESRLGVEIDARTLVHHAAAGRLGFSLGPLTPDMAFSMLWLRGAPARAQRLEHWHAFRSNVLVDRLIMSAALDESLSVVNVTKPQWLNDYIAGVERDGRAVLEAPYRDRQALAQALRDVAVTAIDRNALRVYGRVTALNQSRGHLTATISLAEELQ